MGRVRRGDVGGRVYHALNRTDFRSRLFKQEVEKVPDTVSPCPGQRTREQLKRRVAELSRRLSKVAHQGVDFVIIIVDPRVLCQQMQQEHPDWTSVNSNYCSALSPGPIF